VERTWTAGKRAALAAALLTLTDADRTLCERYYHAGWSAERLATEARPRAPAIRKRLQRVRDRLRKEIEMTVSRNAGAAPEALPEKIIELLARPRLTELPENPVGRAWEWIRPHFSGFEEMEVPEIIAEADVRGLMGSGAEPYLSLAHRVDPERLLRADLEIPMLLSLRGVGRPVRRIARGKSYRAQEPSRKRMESFHQAEFVLAVERPDEWSFAGVIARVMADLFPGRGYLVEPLGESEQVMCGSAWELSLDREGEWWVVASWGRHADGVVRWLGLNPERYAVIGGGFGLERIAALRLGIDDIRKMELASA
jgi:hypothetical protein